MESSSSAHVPNRGPWVLGVQYSLTAAATVCLLVRLYVRSGLRRTFGWDDFFLCLSWVAGLYELVLMQLSVNAGFGRHLQDIHPDQFQAIIRYSILGEILTPFGIGFVKIAVIIFVLRMVKKAANKGWVRWICYIDLLLFVPVTVAFFFVICFQCIPLSVAWRNFMPANKCMDKKTVATVMAVQSAFSALSDLITSVLPIFVLKALQIDRGLKLWSCTLLGMGCIVTSLSILRAIVGYKSLIAPITDQGWALAPGAVWAIAEHEVGIMVACIPIFTPMLLHGLDSARTTFSYIKTWASSTSRLLSRGSEARSRSASGAGLPLEKHEGGAVSGKVDNQTGSSGITCTFEVTVESHPRAMV